MTSVLCSSPMDEGGCVIRYGLNSSYQDLGPPVSIPLNTVSTLPNIASSTLYYFTMNVTIGSTSFQLKRTLTTGNGEAKTIYFFKTSSLIYLIKDFSFFFCSKLKLTLIFIGRHLSPANITRLVQGLVFLIAGVTVFVIGLIFFIKYRHRGNSYYFCCPVIVIQNSSLS